MDKCCVVEYLKWGSGQKKRERAYNITPEVCCKKIPMCAYNISIFSMLNFFFGCWEYKIVLTHTEEERRMFLKKLRVVYIQKGLTLRYTGDGRRFFKEIYSGVYPKRPNSWIHSTGFKLL